MELLLDHGKPSQRHSRVSNCCSLPMQTGVCYLELWPEAKKCHEDRRLWQGIALGSIVMGSTLLVGV